MTMLRMGSAGWLSDSVGEDDGARLVQLRWLREKCIVSVVFMAVNVAVSSEQHEKCFLVTDLVADEQYRLFSVTICRVVLLSW